VDAVVERMGAILLAGFPAGINDPLDHFKLFSHTRTRAIQANQHISRLPTATCCRRTSTRRTTSSFRWRID